MPSSAVEILDYCSDNWNPINSSNVFQQPPILLFPLTCIRFAHPPPFMPNFYHIRTREMKKPEHTCQGTYTTA
jgi:hypothetical protein